MPKALPVVLWNSGLPVAAVWVVWNTGFVDSRGRYCPDWPSGRRMPAGAMAGAASCRPV